MSNNNPYHISLRTGSRLYFRRTAADGTYYPLIDFGHVDPLAPNHNIQTLERVDGWGGIGQTVEQAVTGVSTSIDVTGYSFNEEMFALAFAAELPSAISQSATPVTDIEHANVLVGNQIKLIDGSGDPIYNIASIQGVELDPNGSPSALTLGTDYEVTDLKLGLIRLIPGGAAGAKGATVTLDVDYTPNALSGARVIKPLATPLIEGTFYAFWASNDFSQYRVWEGTGSLRANNYTPQFTDWSNVSLTLQVLADLTQPTQPAGKLIHIYGDRINS